MLKTITTNARGNPTGESNPSHLYSDAQVELARGMYAAGSTTGEIAKAIGAHPATIWRWVTQRRRNPPVAVRVVRVDQSGLPGKGRAPAPSSPMKPSVEDQPYSSGDSDLPADYVDDLI